MKEHLAQQAVEIGSNSVTATQGVAMTVGGSATAAIFGYSFTQVELQAFGILVGALVGVLGVIVTAIAKYYERKDRVQAMLNKGDWDGIERRTNGRSNQKSV